MADCPYTKVAIMQLFYELKERFPAISDPIITDMMKQTSFNRRECEKKLQEQQRKFQPHSYPADIVIKMTENKRRPEFLPVASCSAAWNKGDEQGSSRMNIASENAENLQRNVTVTQSNNTSCCEAVRNMKLCGGDGGCDQSQASTSDLKSCVRQENCARDQLSSQATQSKKNEVVGGSHSAPTTPSVPNCDLNEAGVRKHRSSLNVDRPAVCPGFVDAKRPSTSVMLTLRPPSTENLQSLINITTTGSQLTYASTSYDAKQGYQNQLQISINENGKSILSANRVRTNSSIPIGPVNSDDSNADETVSSVLPSFKNALSSTLELRIREQEERKKKLEMELFRSRQTLSLLQQEIIAMEEDLERRKKPPQKSEEVLRLQEEVQALRNECSRMYIECESREHSLMLLPNTVSWRCSMCTFMNHPMLPHCEQCGMAQIDVSSSISRLLRPPTTSIHTQN